MVDHFLLHEMVHIDNDLTSYKYHDTDHAPSVATAVDYDADASAILAALHLWRSEQKTEDLAESWKGPLKKRIQAALLSMELFTDLYATSTPVTVFSEQLFLRYFLWHFQHARAVDWANKSSPLRDFRLRAYPIIDLPDLKESRKLSGPWINQSLLERDRLRMFLTIHEDDRPRRIIRFISSDARFGKYVFEGITDRDPEKSRLGFAELFSGGEGRALIDNLRAAPTIQTKHDSEWMVSETDAWASEDTKQH